MPLLLRVTGFYSTVYLISNNLTLLSYVEGLLVYFYCKIHIFFCQWNAAIGFNIDRCLADFQGLNQFVERGQLQSIVVIG